MLLLDVSSVYYNCLFFKIEIEVDDTSAVDTVVKSDKVRMNLLQEEINLTKLLEEGDSSVGERLKEV